MELLGNETHYFIGENGTKSALKRAESMDFWKELNPSLSISSNPFESTNDRFEIDERDALNNLETIKEDGYFLAQPMIPQSVCKPLVNGISRVISAGFHPNFAMVYDEFWQVYPRLAALLSPILGDNYQLIGDFWVWWIEANHSQRGWRPHRDFQHLNSLRPDRRPSVMTVWIPLTDSTPLNGCMHVLPTSLDPNISDDIYSDVIGSVQDIHALPATAGSVLGWNQYILHWGGRCSKRAPHPRISYAMYAKSANREIKKELVVDFSDELPFKRRLALISYAFLLYRTRFEFPEALIKLATKFWFGQQLVTFDPRAEHNKSNRKH